MIARTPSACYLSRNLSQYCLESAGRCVKCAVGLTDWASEREATKLQHASAELFTLAPTETAGSCWLALRDFILTCNTHADSPTRIAPTSTSKRAAQPIYYHRLLPLSLSLINRARYTCLTRVSSCNFTPVRPLGDSGALSAARCTSVGSARLSSPGPRRRSSPSGGSRRRPCLSSTRSALLSSSWTYYCCC